MQWSPQQDAALCAISDWHKAGDASPQLFRLFGYAGTGKTTLAKTIAEGIGGKTFYGTFTGKAAHVLRTKGCDGATTIHSLIYHPKEKSKSRLKELEQAVIKMRAELLQNNPGGDVTRHKPFVDLQAELDKEKSNSARPMFTLNELSEIRNADIVIIDECSMVDEQMALDLMSFGKKVLVLGDPAQLPPVGGNGYFIEAKPDFMLTDIHRQAKDNPIIWMATEVRNERSIPLGNYGDSRVYLRKDLDKRDVLDADQVLVGKNQTKLDFNKRMRELQGKTGVLPVAQDKLVCLRNNHDVGLLNGAIWVVEEVGGHTDNEVEMKVTSDDTGATIEVISHMAHFQGRKLDWWEKKDAEEFDYGYALTCHKAQGSQWKNLMLFDESSSFRADRWKWLYTGITRAAERVDVVKS